MAEPVRYVIKEAFYTVQGEGYHAGTPAVFIRFAGCNMWSGYEQHRERDAVRNRAECPRWCDTDFVGGHRCTAAELEHLLWTLGVLQHLARVPLVVLTGGEPLLQLDGEFVAALRSAAPRAQLAVETNGTVQPRVSCGTTSGVDWVCVSPKRAVKDLQLTRGDELKVVYPAYDPLQYVSLLPGFRHAFVSAEALTTGVGRSIIVADNLRRAAEFVMKNPQWRLTLQSHKVIGVP